MTRTSIVLRLSILPAISAELSRISRAHWPVSTAFRETETICSATSRAASEVCSTVRDISDVTAFCSPIALAIVWRRLIQRFGSPRQSRCERQPQARR